MKTIRWPLQKNMYDSFVHFSKNNNREITKQEVEEIITLHYYYKYLPDNIVMNNTQALVKRANYFEITNEQFNIIHKFTKIGVEKLKLAKWLKNFKDEYYKRFLKEIEHQMESGELESITFKIGDEFEAVSGKGSFNKMKAEGLCSDTYDEEKGCIYPFYDASTKNNHIKGYCKEYNVEGGVIKFTRKGDAGACSWVSGRSYIGDDAILLKGIYNSPYMSIFLNYLLPYFSIGSAQKGLQFSYYKDEYITIPKNHAELSKDIERLNSIFDKLDFMLKV